MKILAQSLMEAIHISHATKNERIPLCQTGLPVPSPSMFGRNSIARQRLYAVSDSNALRTLLRCLKLVPITGLISLVLLYILYSIAEYKFTNWLFAVGYVWKPAFPRSWRILLLSLFLVPMVAFLHLVWLSLHYLVPTQYQWWSSDSLEERELLGARDDQDYDLGDIEDPGSLRPNFPHQAPRHHLSFVWSRRFMFWFAILCTSLWLGVHYQQPGDVRYLPLIEKANAHPNRTGYANQEKVFIGAMFYNNQDVIPYWSNSIIKAIHYLGADNVFVSIVESESDDQSPALLQQLDDRLETMRVQRRILTNDTAVTKPHDLWGNYRIDFLSALRNRVLEPLVENGGYDKVIFSNDIFIEPETILELLNTAEGEYDMVCGMDYGQYGLYDMWVLRDKRGRLGSAIWPYFFDMEDYEAMKTESPVPVFACWNGIVVFNADPVLPIQLRSNRTLSNYHLPFALPATHPATIGPNPALTPPVRFRASAPGECFSSECFLLPYDFRRVFNMQRIFVNPRVIVGYEWRYYIYFKWFMRHPVLKWWIEKVYDGAWMQKAVLVVGDVKRVWQWDGGDCHPW
ncbi:cryptococcal mannosyltransferase 1-domain-containing protein [Boletus edulis BED1]|uniref:Cryptococcal mannosyltransferase 1-domain-containing protein n=1 Tax=Boletus edulis BED1 TaxID=1328754 RepID=A0AAD4BJG4_BOLED|nr:cryptococcal mannosyltransferase 1-domain-containing protein [Boletus edulis BED1]